MTTAAVEPEWDAASRRLALGLAAYEDTLCPACGGPAVECQAPENTAAFIPKPPIRCHRKTAVGEMARRNEKEPVPEALMYPVELLRTDGDL